jgi:predicted acylesterase/phospholipase RssA
MTERAATTGKGQEERVDLVLEGGGVKGIALIGALSVLLISA